jgi:hypothetical protein
LSRVGKHGVFSGLCKKPQRAFKTAVERLNDYTVGKYFTDVTRATKGGLSNLCTGQKTVDCILMEHGPHSSTLVVICIVRLLFVLFYVLFVCKCVLPPGDNPTAVNKCVIQRD